MKGGKIEGRALAQKKITHKDTCGQSHPHTKKTINIHAHTHTDPHSLVRAQPLDANRHTKAFPNSVRGVEQAADQGTPNSELHRGSVSFTESLEAT